MSPQNPFNNKTFNSLKREWYSKLRKSGFEDIEQDEENFKAWASSALVQNFDPVKYETKAEYYRLAGHFLNEYEFSSKVERKIWELHSEGVSVVDIKKNFRRSKIWTKRKISITIKMLSEKMLSQCLTK